MNKPENQGEKRGVIEEGWTPELDSMKGVEEFEAQMDKIAATLPNVSPPKEP